MKNLYIYTLDKYGNIEKEVWEDVKVTREDKKIVTKRSAAYRLSHGNYKYEKDLEVVRCITRGFPVSLVERTEYFSFNLENITLEVLELLKAPFLEHYSKQQEDLRKQIDDLENLKLKYKNLEI